MSSKRRANKDYAKDNSLSDEQKNESPQLETLPLFSEVPSFDESDFSQGKVVIGESTVTVFTPKGLTPPKASKESKDS